MDSYNYERNITEIKKEYENILIDTIYPSIYRGLYSMYYASKNNFIEMHSQAQKNPGIKLLKLITTFRQHLKNVEHLSKSRMEGETNKIKGLCGRSDHLDELIMACIKSQIVLLSYSYSNKKCRLIKEKLHKNIDSVTFIHNCYIECANIFVNHAELFYDCELSKESNIVLTENDILINRRYIYELIKTGIKNAIRNSIPLKRICEEYLNKDFPEENTDNHYNRDNFGEMIKKSLGGDLYGGDIVEDNEEFEEDVSNDDITNELVFNRKEDAETSNAPNTEKNDSVRHTTEEKRKSVPDSVVIKKEDDSEHIDINHSTETKEINIDFEGSTKKDTTLKNAIEDYKKNKGKRDPDIDIIRA